MRPKPLAAVALLLFMAPAIRADGCKFARDGRTVPEHEQRALIEWADGTETLHVAALSDPTTEGSVWVVPVRAPAAAVRAEPVEEFPAVTYYETLKGSAERKLRDAITLAAVLDSGGLACPVLLPHVGCGGAGSATSAVEHSRVEKLGMVVTVVSAGSRDALERYLDARGVDRSAADLSSLGPYLGGDGFAFVCGWVAKPGEPSAATGLKVVFPSPTLWFPLMPTRAYTNPVGTVVYVRGFAKPADGCDLPGLKCQYIDGRVEPKTVRDAFATQPPQNYPGSYPHGRLERMTRVTLTANPQEWDRDLELVPGTTPVGTAAVAVTGWVGYYGPLWSALLGAVLGLAIPWLTVPRAERRWFDWPAGASTGAAIVFTIWASALVFAAWRGLTFRGRPNQPRRYVVLPALAVAHFAVVFAVCRGLMAWIAAEG